MTKQRLFWIVAALVVVAGLLLVLPGSPLYLPDLLHRAPDHVAGSGATLLENLKSPQPEVRHKAAADLSKIGPGAGPAVPALAAMVVEDPDPQVRRMAAFALSRMVPTSRSAVTALARALKDNEPFVRIWATMALCKLKADARSAIPALSEAVKDDANQTDLNRFGFTIQELAVLTIGRASVGCIDGLPAITGVLESSKRPGMIVAAIRALGEIGPLARPAVPLLKKLLKSDIRYIRDVAQEALEKIAG